ncbi:hypothetical protein RAAC3_TM7C00001G0232 [Candidatus Saccharibacteria bacterium RAAC3_TM7_1]|nr:hypothetical protein RAAC3_TM7C00001G0232 [Candidatus Saccharibacteria bacterium RAAC3_TM7_1]HCZ28738.1 hypothetical protein [Candidatus Saccharibacteria bacterium]
MENQNENDPINNDSRPPESFVPPTSQQPANHEPSGSSFAPSPSADPVYVQSVPEQTVTQVPKPKKWLLPTVLIALIVLILIGTGLVAFAYLQNKPSSSASTTTGTDCTETAAPLTDSSAKTAYKIFVNALKSGDQTCVDKLSTDVFQKVQAQTFAASDGKWLSKVGDNSGVTDFKKLSNDLNADKFSTAPYVRADYSAYPGLADVGQPEGTTVKYTVKGDGGYDIHLNLSFVASSGKVLVDNLVVIPARIDE